MKFGYLGPPGSYNYEIACLCAAKAVIGAELIALPDFTAIVKGVEMGELALWAYCQ